MKPNARSVRLVWFDKQHVVLTSSLWQITTKEIWIGLNWSTIRQGTYVIR